MNPDPATEASRPPLLKRIFILFCILPFILLPLLSLDAGISGDEPVHHAHAAKVYQFFKTKGEDRSALNTPETYLRYYGQFADDLSYRLAKILKAEDPYKIRHLVSSFSGALTILFAALLAFDLAGSVAGILTILFLLLSPPFLGHSFNNLKDIPFALGYTMTLWFLFRFMRALPSVKPVWIAGITAGIAFSVSVRAGGLLLFPIVFAFGGLQGLLKQPQGDYDRTLFWIKLFASFLAILLLGWILGILDWPYARLGPVSNTLKALALMTRYNVSIRQLFDGQMIWSEEIPWYYAPRYLLITTPEIILAGWILAAFFAVRYIAKKQGRLSRPFWHTSNLASLNRIIMLIFSVLFPILWIIVKDSNLYGGIRHLLFIYPIAVVFAAWGWSLVIKRAARLPARILVSLLLIGGCSGPLVHIVRNHPVEYVYFNPVSGGLNRAWGRYETDYYYHSLGPAVKWVQENLTGTPGEKPVTIASGFPLEPFFLTDKTPPETVYVPYLQKGMIDWDYGIFPVAYLPPSMLVNGCWPPPGTLHTIYSCGHPVCVVVKRLTREDLMGYEAYHSDRFEEAINHFKAAVEADSCDLFSWLWLGWSYRKLGDFTQSNLSADRLLQLHPGSEPALELKIWNHRDLGQQEAADSLATILKRINSKYPPLKGFLKNVKSDSD